MPTQQQLDRALTKLQAGLRLTDEELHWLSDAAKQAGEFGSRVRAAFDNK
jgi:hypothetical protein